MRHVFFVAAICLLAAVVDAHVYEANEINCIGANDEGRKYRDIHDASQYWICPAGQDFGVKQSCPADTAFLETEQECVPWSVWFWKPPYTK